MTIKEPKSMQECVYFTIRAIGKGKIKAWVLKNACIKCNKGLMEKPKNPKTGKPKIRATEYVCSDCNYTIEKEEYEPTLTASIKYTCPHCEIEAETKIPFKRKKVQIFYEEKQKKVAVESLRFQCEKCGNNIDITKKMK